MALPRPLVALATAVLLASGAVEAMSHAGTPAFVSEVRRVVPAAPGLDVRVLDRDDRLAIRNPGRHTVVVLGYGGEPYARLLPDGTVQVNARSPATYLNEDRFGKAALPPGVDARADPLWRSHPRAGGLEWHDHRIHWMGVGVPPRAGDYGGRAEVFDYRVPILVDGRRTVIEGTLYRAGRPGGPSWAAIIGFGAGPAALLLAALIWLRLRASRPNQRRGSVAVG